MKDPTDQSIGRSVGVRRSVCCVPLGAGCYGLWVAAFRRQGVAFQVALKDSPHEEFEGT